MNDDQARRYIAKDAQSLMAELHQVIKNLQPGTPEREAKEDFLYQKLFVLADLIKKKNWTDQNMRELYQIITNEPLNPVRTVAALPVYSDEGQVFSVFPAHPKTRFFLETLVSDMKLMPSNDFQSLMEDPTRDGPKEVLNLLVANCSREKILHTGATHTCQNCRKTVFRDVFLMITEMVTVELQSRSRQVKDMTEKRIITRQQSESLSKILAQSVVKIESLVERGRKKQEKSGPFWVDLVEQMFQVMISFINEIMMQYFVARQVQMAIEQGRELPLIR